MGLGGGLPVERGGGDIAFPPRTWSRKRSLFVLCPRSLRRRRSRRPCGACRSRAHAFCHDRRWFLRPGRTAPLTPGSPAWTQRMRGRRCALLRVEANGVAAGVIRGRHFPPRGSQIPLGIRDPLHRERSGGSSCRSAAASGIGTPCHDIPAPSPTGLFSEGRTMHCAAITGPTSGR
jgi:hypothetical protein